MNSRLRQQIDALRARGSAARVHVLTYVRATSVLKAEQLHGSAVLQPVSDCVCVCEREGERETDRQTDR